jgi:hypothetical protein
VVILNHLVKKTNQNITIIIFLQFPAKGTQITSYLHILKLIIIKFRLFNNIPPKASIVSQQKNIAGFKAVQMNIPTQHLTSDLDDKYMELAAQLAEAHATIDILQTSKLALSNQVSLLEAELSKALEALKVEKSQLAELYQCFHVERHAHQHGAACKDFLESKMEIL